MYEEMNKSERPMQVVEEPKEHINMAHAMANEIMKFNAEIQNEALKTIKETILKSRQNTASKMKEESARIAQDADRLLASCDSL